RAEYGIDIGKNTVHGSDSEESAKKEIPIVFDEKDFLGYKRIDKEWVYEK
ncbi:MAG: nucleoside-diphosphate kinase, partial [Nanoarchaeota archaeon]|nr:nucleoside-diphosphate kinase [Nanoarchaeota archaeon]